MLQYRWRHLDNFVFGLLNYLSQFIQAIDLSELDRLPDISRGSTILIGSDYSGQHASSDYDVSSFLLADIQHSRRWADERDCIRRTLPTDNRRYAIKSLGDRLFF